MPSNNSSSFFQGHLDPFADAHIFEEQVEQARPKKPEHKPAMPEKMPSDFKLDDEPDNSSLTLS